MTSAMLMLLLALPAAALAQGDPEPKSPPFPQRPAEQARAGRPGPWDRDVIVYHVAGSGEVEPVARFERAGVPTITRLADGRLIAAHQHFPADLGPDFDKVAVRFSSDEGRTWSAPQVIQVAGLPEGMRFPFDPTLVSLPDGRVRLYFTGMRGRLLGASSPAIQSALSRDGVNYEFEPGIRFGIEGRSVIDCAVVLHRDVFHLFSPNNGTASGPRRSDDDHWGRGYHATSNDGLNFTRAPDIQIERPWFWLGNAQSNGEFITFYGTGEGLAICASKDGMAWSRIAAPAIPGGDPGAVTTRDGGLIVVITGEPRRENHRR